MSDKEPTVIEYRVLQHRCKKLEQQLKDVTRRVWHHTEASGILGSKLRLDIQQILEVKQ